MLGVDGVGDEDRVGALTGPRGGQAGRADHDLLAAVRTAGSRWRAPARPRVAPPGLGPVVGDVVHRRPRPASASSRSWGRSPTASAIVEPAASTARRTWRRASGRPSGPSEPRQPLDRLEAEDATVLGSPAAAHAVVARPRGARRSSSTSNGGSTNSTRRSGSASSSSRTRNWLRRHTSSHGLERAHHQPLAGRSGRGAVERDRTRRAAQQPGPVGAPGCGARRRGRRSPRAPRSVAPVRFADPVGHQERGGLRAWRRSARRRARSARPSGRPDREWHRRWPHPRASAVTSSTVSMVQPSSAMRAHRSASSPYSQKRSSKPSPPRRRRAAPGSTPRPRSRCRSLAAAEPVQAEGVAQAPAALGNGHRTRCGDPSGCTRRGDATPTPGSLTTSTSRSTASGSTHASGFRKRITLASPSAAPRLQPAAKPALTAPRTTVAPACSAMDAEPSVEALSTTTRCASGGTDASAWAR